MFEPFLERETRATKSPVRSVRGSVRLPRLGQVGSDILDAESVLLKTGSGPSGLGQLAQAFQRMAKAP